MMEDRLDVVDEHFLWNIVDLAWLQVTFRTSRASQQRILEGTVADVTHEIALFCAALEEVLARTLNENAYIAFVKAFESKVRELDTEALANRVALDDEAFVHARFFVVAVGKAYFDEVQRNPSAALVGIAARRVHSVLHRTYERRFSRALPPSEFDITTGTNRAGWGRPPASRSQTRLVAVMTDMAVAAKPRRDTGTR